MMMSAPCTICGIRDDITAKNYLDSKGQLVPEIDNTFDFDSGLYDDECFFELMEEIARDESYMN